MAFELDENEDAATNIRRIVRERVDIALDCLAGAHGRGEGERVHTARKRFKEIRAALRSIRVSSAARTAPIATRRGRFRRCATLKLSWKRSTHWSSTSGTSSRSVHS